MLVHRSAWWIAATVSCCFNIFNLIFDSGMNVHVQHTKGRWFQHVSMLLHFFNHRSVDASVVLIYNVSGLLLSTFWHIYEMGRWANVRHSPLQSRHSWYLLPFTFIWGSQHWKIYLWSIALSATKISNQPNLTQPNPTESNINLPMLGAKDSQSLQCFYLFARGQKGNGLVLWVEKFRRPTTAPQRIRSIVSAQKLKGILLVLLTYFFTIDVKYICISTYVFFQTFVLILRLK